MSAQEWEVVNIHTVPMTPEQYDQAIQALSNLILTHYNQERVTPKPRKPRPTKAQVAAPENRAAPGINQAVGAR